MFFPKTTLNFIFYFVRQQWFKFFIICLISIVWAINDTIFPYFLKLIVDILDNFKGDRSGVYQAVSHILILLVSVWLISEILQRVQGIIQIYYFPRFRAEIRKTVLSYIQSHSHEYFTTHFAGNLAKKINDLPNSAQTIVEIICLNFVTAGVGAIIVLGMMWVTQPLFAVVVFLWLCVHLLLTFLFLRYGNHLWEIHSHSVANLSGKIVDSLSNMMNVRIFARSRYELKHLKKPQEDEIKKSKRAMWFMEINRIGLGINSLFLIFGMVFLLLYAWEHNWITLGDFTQVGMQAFWLLGWIWFISFQLMIFARELGTITDSLKLVRRGHDLIDQPGAKPLVVTKGEIRFNNVNFSYHRNRPIFKDLNLIIPAGQKVGLVGFSGSGKSTFVNLILRFYDIQSGSITIDGQNIAQVTQDSLRSQIAMIPQDPTLFHRTLMENIRYGRLAATDEEVAIAAQLAHCNSFIEKIEGGYNALVGERGIKLSGGQRQRIAIARAILKNAPILILDEATSSLDSVTERVIQDSLKTLMQQRTTIVVAHRLSTLSSMDVILVFHKGQIVESGSKAELLKMKGHFAQLWQMQTDGFLPNKI